MRRVLVAAILAIAVSSCEKESGTPVDVSLTSLFVSGSVLSQNTINLDDTSSTSHVVKLPNGQFRITDSIFTIVTLPPGQVNHITVDYWIYAPGSTQYFAHGNLHDNALLSTSTSLGYSGVISFDLDRSDVGKYVVEITSNTLGGKDGNRSLLSLFITRNNVKPNTSGLVAPDTLYRPTSGYKLVSFAISAQDSDGYGDIDEVFLKRISPSESSIIPMYDDGDEITNGDPVAGDGTFTRILRIDNTALLGDQVFLFQALDRSGALSDTLLHTITIVQGP